MFLLDVGVFDDLIIIELIRVLEFIVGLRLKFVLMGRWLDFFFVVFVILVFLFYFVSLCVFFFGFRVLVSVFFCFEWNFFFVEYFLLDEFLERGIIYLVLYFIVFIG